MPAETSSPTHRTVFLLGAGASKPAGVPTTLEFSSKFLAQLDPSERRVLLPLWAELEAWAAESGRALDVELLYDVLQRLARPGQDFLASRPLRQDAKLAEQDAQRLLRDLEAFIVKSVLVMPEAVSYLEPLRYFVTNGEPLHVFTTNYDTCVEVLCEELRLRWEDGFALHWDESMFDRVGIDVRLHKLHGSALWVVDEDGVYRRSLSLPAAGPPESVESRVFTGQKCQPMLLYPAAKAGFNAPFVFNLHRLRTLLETASLVTTLIVIGYSFRDDDLCYAVWDSARRNRNLRVILVDPSAERIYREVLVGKKAGRAVLRGRVVRYCQPIFREQTRSLLATLAAEVMPRATNAARAEAEYEARVNVSFEEWTGLARAFLQAEDLNGFWRCMARRQSVDPGPDLNAGLQLRDLLVEARLCLAQEIRLPPDRPVELGLAEALKRAFAGSGFQADEDQGARLIVANDTDLAESLRAAWSAAYNWGRRLTKPGASSHVLSELAGFLLELRDLADTARRDRQRRGTAPLPEGVLRELGVPAIVPPVTTESLTEANRRWSASVAERVANLARFVSENCRRGTYEAEEWQA